MLLCRVRTGVCNPVRQVPFMHQSYIYKLGKEFIEGGGANNIYIIVL
jgi:hypothetical protein